MVYPYIISLYLMGAIIGYGVRHGFHGSFGPKVQVTLDQDALLRNRKIGSIDDLVAGGA